MSKIPAGDKRLPRTREAVRKRDARIVELYENGCSSHDIAKALGMSSNGVLTALRRNGVEVRPVGRNSADYAQQCEDVRRLRKEGLTVVQIAATTGLTKDTVKWRLRQMGMTTNRPGRPPKNDYFLRDRR